ncbi:MAG: mobile mystery protein A [Ectothiorhodospiraceae bacterium]|nr:mobile mystery protein A [Ectothiorhodospiraceae bacterium]
MMKDLIRSQYQLKMDQLIDSVVFCRPKEGWIRTLRKALGMSGPQLARRLGVSKSQVSQMERMELEDRITLMQLRRVAESLDCDLHYALVPRQPISKMVRDRAKMKAHQLVEKTNVQMSLEAQQLSKDALTNQFDREVSRLVRELPRDLWED